MRWRWPPENSCGVAVHGGGVEPDVVQRCRHDLAPVPSRQAAPLDEEPLLDDLGDGQTGRQRPVRVLEDDLHVAAEGTHRLRAEPVDLLPEKEDPTLGSGEPQQGEPERRLARTGLAHDSDRLALADHERDAVDRLHAPDRPAQKAASDGGNVP